MGGAGSKVYDRNGRYVGTIVSGRLVYGSFPIEISGFRYGLQEVGGQLGDTVWDIGVDPLGVAFVQVVIDVIATGKAEEVLVGPVVHRQSEQHAPGLWIERGRLEGHHHGVS